MQMRSGPILAQGLTCTRSLFLGSLASSDHRIDLFQWSIEVPGRPNVTVAVANEVPGSTLVKVWVFDPSQSAVSAVQDEVSSDADVDRLIARIKATIRNGKRG